MCANKLQLLGYRTRPTIYSMKFEDMLKFISIATCSPTRAQPSRRGDGREMHTAICVNRAPQQHGLARVMQNDIAVLISFTHSYGLRFQ